LFFLKKKNIPIKSLIPKDYVDIHSHLLPGIDDGAKNIYDTTKLVSELNNFGINKFITTPHIMQDVWPNTTEKIEAKLLETKNLLATLKIENLKLDVAAEYMLDDLFTERLKNNNLLTLKDNYLLIEMSTLQPRLDILEVIFEIKLAGYQPILAHPERYHYYHKKPERYLELKKAGCDFQLNLLSLFNYYGESVQEMSYKLIEEELIDFTGTDVHNTYQIKKLHGEIPRKLELTFQTLLQKNTVFN
jgi:tyrosine-protein phosphatase YwqE